MDIGDEGVGDNLRWVTCKLDFDNGNVGTLPSAGLFLFCTATGPPQGRQRKETLHTHLVNHEFNRRCPFGHFIDIYSFTFLSLETILGSEQTSYTKSASAIGFLQLLHILTRWGHTSVTVICVSSFL